MGPYTYMCAETVSYTLFQRNSDSAKQMLPEVKRLHCVEITSGRGVGGWRSEPLVGKGLHLILCMPNRDDSVGPEVKMSPDPRGPIKPPVKSFVL